MKNGWRKMNRKITKLSKHCRLILEKDKKFKFIGIEVVFRQKYHYEDITAYRVLSKILTNCNQTYPSIELMNKRKDELYSLDIGFTHQFFAKLSQVKFICSYVNPYYIQDKDYQENVIKLLYDCIYHPQIKNGSFDRGMFQIAKDLVQHDIMTQKDNPVAHAITELLQNVGTKRQAISASTKGDKNVLKRLNERNLTEYYDKLLHAPFDIYIIGDFQYESMIQLIKKYFVQKTAEKKNYLAAIPLEESKVNPKTIYKDVNQAKVVLLYTTQVVFNHQESYAMRILNDILGAGMQSKLFVEIREKLGLCYSISSSYNTSYGYLLIHTGVQPNNVSKVIEEINKQIEEIKKGNFSQKDLKRSIDSFCRAILNYKDDLFSYMDLHIRYSSFQQKFDLKEILQCYQNVTKKDVIDVAQKLQYKTHVVVTKKDDKK